MPSDEDFRRLSQQVGELASSVAAAKRRIAELEDFATDHIGLDWGATGYGYPHPTALSMHREIHGPSKSSIDSTHSVTFPVDFDDSISHLHQSKLLVRLSAVRSNVSTAASGGSSTPTSSSGGAHGHLMFAYDGSISNSSGLTGSNNSAGDPHDHDYLVGTPIDVFKGKKSNNADHPVAMVEYGAHEDIYTYQDSSTHTHTVTIASHTHDLAYGIYDGSAPSTPQITVTINGVDRTSALGGPWDDDFTSDITAYLRDANNGSPLRQVNTIVLTSDELLDVEITVKSFASAVPPASIGVQS